MELIRAHLKAFLFAALFAIVVAILSTVAYISWHNWTEEVIRSNKALTVITAGRLGESAQPIMDSLAAAGFFDKDGYSRAEILALDKRLQVLSSSIFSDVSGLEGGFFYPCIEEFLGYAYPSSPPPQPVYGPPPRSYNIIKHQAQESVDSSRTITDLHKFDPAVFPLTTVPLVSGGKVVGAAWTRVHIEREMPAIKLRQIINIGGAVTFLGLVVSILISVSQRRRLNRLLADLEEIQTGRVLTARDQGGTIGSIARSVNSMVHALDEAHSRREKLEKSLHQQDKMAALGTLVAGVVHEVKTPLAIVKTRIQIWQQELAKLREGDGEVNPKEVITEESLQGVVHEINRLAGLANRLLIFSRPISELRQETNLAPLIERTISLVKSSPRAENVNIILNIQHVLPPVWAEPNSLEQVFLNVLTNAVEAIKDRGEISVEAIADYPEGKLVVEVRDNGVGIPESIRTRMFDPFVTSKEKGFGLGLSITYEILSAHNGSIEFSDRDGGGAVCTITLPFARKGLGLS
ncbi:MAG TPA: ATP-binding protein [candidate division Zixibacteria bacterium]|nr:ATP-binding protein [candidate division Zixibacteria bacterium]